MEVWVFEVFFRMTSIKQDDLIESVADALQ